MLIHYIKFTTNTGRKSGSFAVRDWLGIWRFRRPLSLMHLLPLCALNRRKTAISKTEKSKLKTQKNRLNRRFFCKIWSECGDSNPGPPAPKAGALPTAQHPDMKLWDCPGVSSQSKRATNCATPGYEVFQLWSNMGSTPVFDQFPARGKTPSALASQSFPGF